MNEDKSEERVIAQARAIAGENARLKAELIEARRRLEEMMRHFPRQPLAEHSPDIQTPADFSPPIDMLADRDFPAAHAGPAVRTPPLPGASEFEVSEPVAQYFPEPRYADRLTDSEKSYREKIDETLRTPDLLDLAFDSVIVRDLHDRILIWNTGAEALYGWTRDEALGRISTDLLHPNYNSPADAIYQTLLVQNWWEGELVHATRDGGKVIVRSRWAILRDTDGRGLAILEVSYDITARKKLEQELEHKSSRLEEVNAALKVLLRQRDEDRREFEEAFLVNIENLIMPYVRRLKSSPLAVAQVSLVEIVESHLRELTSQFGRTLALQYRVLTPTEMRVAALVREGKTSKEIAELLCIAEKTASFHRNNIRQKLGLRGVGANLRSHLLSLT